MLLDASTKQAEVLDQAHSVVLASGTLAPLELLTQQLCRPEDLPRLHKFACGHIVPAERVAAVSLGCGPTGKTIKLTHSARDAHATMDECGLLMNNLCRIVPQGLVVFVASFSYCDSLRQRCDTPSHHPDDLHILLLHAHCTCCLLPFVVRTHHKHIASQR